MTLTNCDRDRTRETPPQAAEAPAPAIAPQALAPAPVLGRAEFIAASGQAASLFASGQRIDGPDPLVGRRFSLKLPFGCGGPAPVGEETPGLPAWRWGEGQRTIRLTLQPLDWTGSPLVGDAPDPAMDTQASQDWEAAEGFWLPRPWLTTEACPDPGLYQSISAPPSTQTLGLAAVFPREGSRLGRRNGRAYEFTVRPSNDQPLAAPAGGFVLRLEGRIVGYPDGRAAHCVAYSPEQRPTCVVAVEMDRVAFEDPGGTTLSEWRTSN